MGLRHVLGQTNSYTNAKNVVKACLNDKGQLSVKTLRLRLKKSTLRMYQSWNLAAEQLFWMKSRAPKPFVLSKHVRDNYLLAKYLFPPSLTRDQTQLKSRF